MTVESLLAVLIIGGLAGWVASLLVKGRGQGIIVNVVVGIVGAFLGSFIFNFLGVVATGLLGSLVVATVGAVVLLVLLQLIQRR